MAYEVGSAYLSILPSANNFARNLGAQLSGPFAAAGMQGGAAIGQNVARGGAAPMAASGKAMGALFVAGFAAVGAGQIVSAVVDWVGEAISAASGLEQSVGAVDAIFKDNASTIHDWAKGAADAVGLSRNEYNELASVIGAQLKNAGIPMDQVTAKTGELVGLGADLAAQFGGSTSDAVSALSSLLRGERDPIERYGVSINEARIKAKMAELGLGGLSGAAEEAAKKQATFALLMEQTADAQGAFARESDTYAGQQQRFNAEMENFRIEVGEALLPVVSELFGVFTKEGLPILRELVDWFIANKEEIRDFALKSAIAGLTIAEVLLAIGEQSIWMAGLWADVFGAMLEVFLWAVDGVLTGAASMLGWIPGVGPMLSDMQGSFREFADGALSGVDSVRDGLDTMGSAVAMGKGLVVDLRDSIAELDGSSATATITVRGVGNGWELVSRGGLTPYLNTSGGGFTSTGVNRRAGGGPVVAGRPYIVGEREAELFVPDRSGWIYNQDQIAAMGGGRPIEQHNTFVGVDLETAERYSAARLGAALRGV